MRLNAFIDHPVISGPQFMALSAQFLLMSGRASKLTSERSLSGRREHDPITTEVIAYNLLSVAEEMKTHLIETGHNPVLYDVRDFGCALIDPDSQMIAQGLGIPVFEGHLGFPLKAIQARHALASMKPGDVYIHNDPYAGGGNHMNDVGHYSPVFVEGRPFCFVGVKAHWIDIGGRVAGSITTNSDEFQEDGLLFHAIKLFSQGVRNDGAWDLIRSNVRTSTGVLQDVEAILSTLQLGARRVQEVAARFGSDSVEGAWKARMDQLETKTRNALLAIPEGEYSETLFLDNDGKNLDRPVRIEPVVRIRNGEMHVDLSRCDEAIGGSTNCGDAIAISGCRLVLKALTIPDEPANEGAFRPLSVTIPPGTVLSAQAPRSVSRYYLPFVTMMEALLASLAQAIPNRVPAGSMGDHCPIIFYGKDPASGGTYVHGDINCGGQGASVELDGESALIMLAGATGRNTSVEVLENRFPFIRVEQYKLRPDSGGAGKTRGGLGVVRSWRFLDGAEGTFSLDRSRSPPQGRAGGLPGAVNRVIIDEPSGKRRIVRKGTRVPIPAGSLVTLETGGGGGYGPVSQRPPQSILMDLAAGYISRKAARLVYGQNGHKPGKNGDGRRKL